MTTNDVIVERLRELAKRLFVIEGLVNGGTDTKDSTFERHVDALAAQSSEMCDGLAAALESGELDYDEYWDEFKTRDDLVAMLRRLGEKGADGYCAKVVAGWLREVEAQERENVA